MRRRAGRFVSIPDNETVLRFVRQCARAWRSGHDFRTKARGELTVRPPRYRWSLGLSSVSVVLVLALGSTLAVPRLKKWFPRDKAPREGLVTTAVRRSS